MDTYANIGEFDLDEHVTADQLAGMMFNADAMALAMNFSLNMEKLFASDRPLVDKSDIFIVAAHAHCKRMVELGIPRNLVDPARLFFGAWQKYDDLRRSRAP